MHNHLSSCSTQAVLCLGDWSLRGLIKDCDVAKVAALPEVKGGEEVIPTDGWDAIGDKEALNVD